MLRRDLKVGAMRKLQLGVLFDERPGDSRRCRSCHRIYTLVVGDGWSRCPICGYELIGLDDLRLDARLSPAARRSRSSRKISLRVHTHPPIRRAQRDTRWSRELFH